MASPSSTSSLGAAAAAGGGPVVFDLDAPAFASDEWRIYHFKARERCVDGMGWDGAACLFLLCGAEKEEEKPPLIKPYALP